MKMETMLPEETSNIKINGENMKPLLAKAVEKLEDVTILNRINITDYIVEENETKELSAFRLKKVPPMR